MHCGSCACAHTCDHVTHRGPLALARSHATASSRSERRHAPVMRMRSSHTTVDHRVLTPSDLRFLCVRVVLTRVCVYVLLTWFFASSFFFDANRPSLPCVLRRDLPSNPRVQEVEYCLPKSTHIDVASHHGGRVAVDADRGRPRRSRG